MKIIEALKQLKYLEKKSEDTLSKIQNHSADMDYETPVYEDQKTQVSKWVQSYKDLLKEIGNLHFRIQQTNISTPVTIELGGVAVTKSIAEWIVRRRKLIQKEVSLYRGLTDKNLQEGNVRFTSGNVVNAKIRRYYDPKEKDHMLDLLSKEPFEIDSKLEIVNAVTELI